MNQTADITIWYTSRSISTAQPLVGAEQPKYLILDSFQQLHSCSTEGRGFLADTDCCLLLPCLFRLVFVLMNELKSIAVVIVPTTHQNVGHYSAEMSRNMQITCGSHFAISSRLKIWLEHWYELAWTTVTVRLMLDSDPCPCVVYWYNNLRSVPCSIRHQASSTALAVLVGAHY